MSMFGRTRSRSGATWKNPNTVRLTAARILPGDILVFRGEDNRRVKEVIPFPPSRNASGKVYLVIANAYADGLEMREHNPEDLVLVTTTDANRRRRQATNRTRAERLTSTW